MLGLLWFRERCVLVLGDPGISGGKYVLCLVNCGCWSAAPGRGVCWSWGWLRQQTLPTSLCVGTTGALVMSP